MAPHRMARLLGDNGDEPRNTPGPRLSHDVDMEPNWVTIASYNAGGTITVHVGETIFTIDLGGDDTRAVRGTTTPVRNTKAHRPRKAGHVS